MASGTRNVQVKRNKLKQQADFLTALGIYISVIRSCKKSKVPRQSVYNWLKSDENFKKLFDEANNIALAALEDEAVRRAHEGTLKPIYQGGTKVGQVREFSDTLMIVLLKAKAPEKYKDRFAGQLSGPGGKPLQVDNTIHHVHSEVPLSETEEEIA